MARLRCWLIMPVWFLLGTAATPSSARTLTIEISLANSRLPPTFSLNMAGGDARPIHVLCSTSRSGSRSARWLCQLSCAHPRSKLDIRTEPCGVLPRRLSTVRSGQVPLGSLRRRWRGIHQVSVSDRSVRALRPLDKGTQERYEYPRSGPTLARQCRRTLPNQGIAGIIRKVAASGDTRERFAVEEREEIRSAPPLTTFFLATARPTCAPVVGALIGRLRARRRRTARWPCDEKKNGRPRWKMEAHLQNDAAAYQEDDHGPVYRTRCSRAKLDAGRVEPDRESVWHARWWRRVRRP